MTDRNAIRLVCVLILSVLSGVVPLAGAQARTVTAPKETTAPRAQTYFTCVWQGQTVQLKHVATAKVETYHDTVRAGACKGFKTNDSYYKSLVGKSINVFVAWRQYPGQFVVRDALQGRQKVYGNWTFPIGLSAPAIVHGTVTDGTTAQPVAGATVSATHCVTKPPKSCTTYSAKTNAQGSYSLKFYLSGKFKVTASATGYGDSRAATVNVAFGKSISTNITISQASTATSLTVTATPNPVNAGQSVTLTATVAQPVDDGLITFSGAGPGGASFTAQTCTPAAGTCAVTWTGATAGLWTITATWAGDSRYAAATNTTSVTVNALTTALSLVTSPSNPAANQNTTVTATLAAPVNDGSVTFTVTGPNNTTVSAAACTPVNGVCTSNFAPPATGSWSIAAVWSGDTQYAPSSAGTQVAVGGGTLTVSVQNAPTQTNVNQAVVTTAHLSQSVSDGTVTFSFSGPTGANVGAKTCTPSNGACSVSWTPNVTGNWTVSVSYSGDSQFGPASASSSVAVTGQAATVTLAVTPSPAVLNNTGTLTAKISPSVSDGTITFTVTGPGNPQLSSQTCVPVAGTCSVTWKPNTTGQWTVIAGWSGDTQYLPASSASSTITVNGIGMTLTASPTNVNLGTTGTLTVSLGQPVNDGSVTFSAKGPNNATVSIAACTPVNGTCSTTWHPTTGGAWSISAVWSGDSAYQGASSNILSVTVSGGSALTLVSSASSVAFGSVDTLTATLAVAASDGLVTFNGTSPSGSVVQIGQCVPNNGVCAVNWTPSTAGTWTVTASWSGDSQNGSSTSPAVIVTVTGSQASALSLSGSSSSVSIGSTVNVTAVVTPAVNDGTVSFTAAGPNNVTVAVPNCTPTNGTCTSSFRPTAGGTWTVFATWSGDAQYSSPPPKTISIQVNLPAPTITITANPSTLSPTQSGTISATLLPAVSDGTITFTVTGPAGSNPNLSQSQCTPHNGTCSISWRPDTDGTYQIRAQWTGDNQYSGVSGNGSATVSGTTLTVDAKPNPVVLNSSDTLTATLGQGTTVPSGSSVTVNFSLVAPSGSSSHINANPSCTIVGGTNACSVTWSPDVSGVWTVNASLASGSTIQAGPANTQVTVTGSAQAALYLSAPANAPINSSVTVNAALDKSVNDGTVTFSATGPNNATATVASCTPISGACSSTFTPSVVGTWTVTATWSGDSIYKSATSSPATVNVQPVQTTLAIAASPSSAQVNAPVTISATLGQSVSDGTIAFTAALNGGATTNLSSCAPAAGKCSITWTPTTVGTWTITATWTGDAQYGAPSATTTVTVSGGSIGLAVTFTPGNPVVNESGQVTATLNRPVGDGTVTFTAVGPNNATNVSFQPATCNPVVNGTTSSCSVNWIAGTAGTWTVTAKWSGDNQYAAQSSSASVLVRYTPTLTLTNLTSSPAANKPVTVGATISPFYGTTNGTTAGTVTFTITGPNSQVLTPNPVCTPVAATNQTGQCSIQFTPTSSGTWTVDAAWSGDANTGPVHHAQQVLDIVVQ